MEWLTTLPRTSSLPARPNRSRIHPTFRRRSGKEEQDTHKGALCALAHLRVPERVAGRHSIVDDLQKADMPSLMETHAHDKVEILKVYDIKPGFISAFCPSVRPRPRGDPPLNASIGADSIVYRGWYTRGPRDVPSGECGDELRSSRWYTDNCGYGEQHFHHGRHPIFIRGYVCGGTDAVCNSVNGGSIFGAPIISPPQAKLGMQAVHGRLFVAIIFLGQQTHIVIINCIHVRLRMGHAMEYVEDPHRMLVAP